MNFLRRTQGAVPQPIGKPDGKGRRAGALQKQLKALGCFGLTALVGLWVCFPGAIFAKEYTDSQAKAAFFFKFLTYTEWPAEVQQKMSAFILGIIGDQPLDRDLGAITNQVVKGRPIVIKRFESVQEIQDCHLLFVSPSEKNNLAGILNHLKDTSVLTIGQIEGFTRVGGIVNFTFDKEDKFEVSKSAVKRAKIKVASELIQCGKLVP